MTSKFTELAIDCADPSGLARFWCSVLDYEVQDEGDGIVTIGSPMVPDGKNRLGPVPPTLTFAHVPDRRLAATDLGREYIPQIYDRVIAGKSLADICGWLDSLHLWQKRDPQTGELADVPWWPTRLADLIRSPVYRGQYCMTRAERDPVTGKVVWSEKWEHSCEALIDARRFRLAN